MKKQRGFAAMTVERRKEVATRGGLAAQKKGVAHHFTDVERSRGGTLGGLIVSSDKVHMAEIGRKGALARARKMEKK